VRDHRPDDRGTARQLRGTRYGEIAQAGLPPHTNSVILYLSRLHCFYKRNEKAAYKTSLQYKFTKYIVIYSSVGFEYNADCKSCIKWEAAAGLKALFHISLKFTKRKNLSSSADNSPTYFLRLFHCITLLSEEFHAEFYLKSQQNM
jgi:hypothetical protein